ncbi:MAG: sigma 54-interacting transcriptional regulator [Candidatus Sulfotelmatobacter sp.]
MADVVYQDQNAAGALLESELLLTAYFSAARVGLAIFDPSLRYVAINQTLAAMHGLPAQDHIGRQLREMLGDAASVIESPCRQVLDTHVPLLNVEVSFKLPTQFELGHWIGHYIPIFDAQGEIRHLGAIILEITQQKKLEETLRGASASLREEKKRLQVMLEVSRALAERTDIAKVFPRISAYLRRVFLQEYAALALHDEENGRLSRQALDFPLQKGSPAVDSEIDSLNDPRGRALLQRSSLIFNRRELQSFPSGTTDHLLSEGLQSLCCVPLLRPKGTLGVLVLGSTRPGAFKSDDLTLVDHVASQLALALESTRTARQLKQLRGRVEQEKRYLEGETHNSSHFPQIIGESQAIKLVLQQVAVVAPSDATVLLLGETGTGKGLAAHAIHRISARSERNFIAVNCAAIPTGLLESELFGHEKGAFTGAISQKIGRLELADKGTLFLDEVGEIPLELQPKLLRVLQDHEFERLGGNRTIKVDIRLIAATNLDLAKSLAEKHFRSDLFYRLNVFPIRMPSLCERREDIPLLVRYFVQKFSRRMDRLIETIPIETMEALLGWQWPGNVRELENFIERSVILTAGSALQSPLAEFSKEMLGSADHSLEETEREYIISILRETDGIVSGATGAARRLGLKRTTLQSKIQRLRITPQDYSASNLK